MSAGSTSVEEENPTVDTVIGSELEEEKNPEAVEEAKTDNETHSLVPVVHDSVLPEAAVTSSSSTMNDESYTNEDTVDQSEDTDVSIIAKTFIKSWIEETVPRIVIRTTEIQNEYANQHTEQVTSTLHSDTQVEKDVSEIEEAVVTDISRSEKEPSICVPMSAGSTSVEEENPTVDTVIGSELEEEKNPEAVEEAITDNETHSLVPVVHDSVLPEAAVTSSSSTMNDDTYTNEDTVDRSEDTALVEKKVLDQCEDASLPDSLSSEPEELRLLKISSVFEAIHHISVELSLSIPLSVVIEVVRIEALSHVKSLARKYSNFCVTPNFLLEVVHERDMQE
jgi:hypothetical protein